jgi:hypothetical protein
MKLTCYSCKVERHYFDKQEAFNDGWDFVSMNGVDAEFCGKCPSGPFMVEQTLKQTEQSEQLLKRMKGLNA